VGRAAADIPRDRSRQRPRSLDACRNLGRRCRSHGTHIKNFSLVQRAGPSGARRYGCAGQRSGCRGSRCSGCRRPGRQSWTRRARRQRLQLLHEQGGNQRPGAVCHRWRRGVAGNRERGSSAAGARIGSQPRSRSSHFARWKALGGCAPVAGGEPVARRIGSRCRPRPGCGDCGVVAAPAGRRAGNARSTRIAGEQFSIGWARFSFCRVACACWR